ncbi:SIS domain-containing protein [Paenibacillus larvae]|nr:SIS domain-containing protein [Paenibacillus larvae]MCY9681093.1 SIS domain-containing protein [Paenibacillus larvae]MCY9744504.1 SIS domain-containing protein [Paenibacillus larvae]MCY9749965.1 SIS domain-containing protein [Paenibacillus larvae]MCY9772714.1 SIS domain-containing protein [Paenibacillus larvae]MDR5606185.1 SIS domain-containing protein [Paenibacillus larvae]
MVDPNDLVVFISSSGKTQTFTKIAEKLKYRNTETVAITNTVE